MRSDVINSSSGSYLDKDILNRLGGSKRVLSFGATTAEAVLDSATTAYSSNDIIHSAGALDVSVPSGFNPALKILIDRVVFCCDVAAGTTMVGNIFVGTTADESLNAAVTSGTEIVGAGASMVAPDGSGGTTGYTEADLNFNSAAVTYAMPGIVLPVATKYVYVCTHTAINHATNFDAGRYNVQIEYTVL